MNLTNLQLELRDIEKHIASLQIEIEQLKPKKEETIKANYDQIAQLAKLFPIKRPSIETADRVLQKEYIVSLAYLFLTSGNKIYDRLLFLSRISVGCKLEMTPEEIYKECLNFEKNEIEKICVELAKYKYSYIVDALIIANITRNPEKRDLAVVTDIAVLLGCDKEEMRVAAYVAKGILIGNYDILTDIPFPTQNRWSGKFKDFLPESWLVAQRLLLKKILIASKKIKKDGKTSKTYTQDAVACQGLDGETYLTNDSANENLCEIKEQIKNENLVKKGDCVLNYLELIKIVTKSDIMFGIVADLTHQDITEKKKHILEAPCNGIVYFKEYVKTYEYNEKENTYLDVYLVSFFDDYADFSKWHELEN